MSGRRVFDDMVVLEVATGSIATSMAGMILADNGARVVKVEPPGGDRLRGWNPSGFLVWNRGKESVSIDLRTVEGREYLRSLATDSDVLLDGLHPGHMRQWGLEYEHLQPLNERLVYCAVRGFAEDGPYADIRAYEGVIAAKVGLFNRGMWAFQDAPMFLNAPVVSVSAGYLTISSVAAALVARESNGLGQRLVVSMYTASTSYDYGLSATFQHRVRLQGADPGVPAGSGGNRSIVYACSADNRWFVFINLLPYQSRAFVQALGMGDLLNDLKFARTPAFDTAEDAEEYEVTMMEAVRNLDGDEIVNRMLSNPDVAFEEIRTTRGAFDHPQVMHNGCAIKVDDPRLGEVREIGPVADFSETPSRIGSSAPWLGENHLRSSHLQSSRRSAEAGKPTLTKTAPLAGLTLLELGHYYAMPYGLSMAASLGARVIKVEGRNPDPWRMLQTTEPEVLASQCTNGKESVAIDLRSEEGRDVLYRLVRLADAFIYSLRPDPAEMAVSYAQLRAINPDIVYVERPGYGTSGPYSGRPMYAHTADALAGMYMSNCGYWLAPERCQGAGIPELKAIQVPRTTSDRMFGDGHGANAVLLMTVMALLAKKRFGIGQYVSTSMMNAVLYAFADDFVEYQGQPDTERFDPEQIGPSALYRLYQAVDDWVFIAAPTQKSWEALARSIERPDLLGDRRLATPDGRRQADEFLVAEIARAIEIKEAAFWEKELNRRGVGCAVANKLQLQGYTSLDIGLRESGLTFPVEHPTLGTLIRIGAPASFSLTPPVIQAGTVYGQSTVPVLEELGYDHSQIEDLLSRRVVFRDERSSGARHS